MSEKSFNKVTIDCGALENNFRYINNLAGERVPVMAMVKADGYGHGMVEAARAFGKGGCSRFGVAELREGIMLRQHGITGQIYVTIGFDIAEVESFFTHDLIPVVYRLDQVEALSKHALSLGQKIGIHLKVDTGMGRLGLLPDEVERFVERIGPLEGVKLEGVMSHFPEADVAGSDSTVGAIEKFSFICKELKSRFGAICHIANSGAVINFPDACCDMVRAGIALYGYHPAGSVVVTTQQGKKLLPAMSFQTRVLQVKELEAGVGISYGHTYKTGRKTRIAVLPVGYEDGFSRGLSNKAEVIIDGKMAAVCGRVCMNMCMVDVTDIEGVEPGDRAVIMGRQDQLAIDADNIAKKIDSISYEVLCMFGNNNIREYR